MKEYDVVVVGFGKGGKTLAAKLGAQGKRVALAEESDSMYGGSCVNVACIPSKSLINNAKLSSLLGGNFEEKAERYQKAVEQKNGIVEKLRKQNYAKLDSMPNVTVYDAHARSRPSRIGAGIKRWRQGGGGCGYRFDKHRSTPVIPDIGGLE